MTNSTDEIWKPIPGFETTYEASSYGRIRSLDKVKVYYFRDKRCERAFKGRVLNPVRSPNGYYMVDLRGESNIAKSVHSLVALAFLGPRPAGMQVCHNNGVRSDNAAHNLRYDWPRANSLDRREHGTMPFADKHPNSKLTSADVVNIRKCYAEGETMIALAERYGCTRENINLIVLGQAWKRLLLQNLDDAFSPSHQEV